MPKSTKPRTLSLAQQLRKDLREKARGLSRQLMRVRRDLRSLGVKKKKHAKGKK